MGVTADDQAQARPRRHRTFLLGLVLGALLVVPGVFVALLVPAAERVWPYLTPGAVLLRPLAGSMATWSGALNLLLLAVVNGLVIGALAAAVALVLRSLARRAGS
jgi:hypothetical protein